MLRLGTTKEGDVNMSYTDLGKQKKIALINDFTGFGRCALTVAIPIISAYGIQACPIPTAVFSNHTAFDSFHKVDFTDELSSYTNEWKKLNLKFDAVLSGYLANERQIDYVVEFSKAFLKEEGKLIVDPIMGDNGHIYKSYDDALVRRMRELTDKAQIITPNVTECCALLNESYDSLMSMKQPTQIKLLKEMAAALGNQVVITGAYRGEFVGNIVYDGNTAKTVFRKKSGATRCGTGDAFASIIAANAVLDCNLSDSVACAADFVKKSIEISDKLEIPKENGVAFEQLLHTLYKK